MSAPVMEMEKHGTYSRYVGGKCRCDECRAANTKYQRQRRASNAAARQYDKQYGRDRWTALEELRERHQDEFDAIFTRIRGTT